MKTHVEVYPRTVRGKRQWFWRMRRKGRICADSSESYLRKPALLKVLKGMISGGFVLTEK